MLGFDHIVSSLVKRSIGKEIREDALSGDVVYFA